MLRPRDLITHLDDLELHDSLTYKHWQHYLLPNDGEGEGVQDGFSRLGWCVPASELTAMPTDCCWPSPSQEDRASQRDSVSSGTDLSHRKHPTSTTHTICFEAAAADARIAACLDPSTLLNRPRCLDACTQQQASRTNHQQYDDICVHPRAAAELLRLTVIDASSGQQQVIFYQGSKPALWRDVKVDRWQAPFWAPPNLPADVRSFWR